MDDPATVVRRCFETVADLGSLREALVELLNPDVRITDHPKWLTVVGGRIREHDTFDRYEPLPAASAAAS